MDFSENDLLQEAKPYHPQKPQDEESHNATVQVPFGLKLGKKKTQTQLLGHHQSEEEFLSHKQAAQSLHFRKKPPIFEQFSSDIDESEVTQKQKETLKPELHKFMRKDFKAKQQNKPIYAKIKQIKEVNKIVSCRGQVIFSWHKQKINEKWAKTEMICIEIYDGTALIMVFIPQKHHNKLQKELKLDNWVEISCVQVRQKFPKSICLLVTDKTKIIVSKSAPQPDLVCQPEKLGVSIKELEEEPVGSVRNLVCMILQKENKQFIRSNKGEQLVLTYIKVFDPRDQRFLRIKLWEEKTDIKFYCGFSVFLLKGVEVREYKGNREYDSTKDFTFRNLRFCAIENYLRPFLDSTDLLIAGRPLKTRESEVIQEKTPNNTSEKHQVENSYRKRLETIHSQAKVEWKTDYLRIIQIETQSKFVSFFCQCARCGSRVMIDLKYNPVCFICGFKKGEKHYSMKFQFSDELNIFQGQIRDEAAEKLFTLWSEPIKAELYEDTHQEFKKRLLGEIIGNVVKGIMATIVHEIAPKILVKTSYLVDILPYDEEHNMEGKQQMTDPKASSEEKY